MKRIILLVAALLSVSTFAAAPKVGENAPEFTAKGADGKTYKLSEFKGKVVVLEWFNKDCPYVRKFYGSKTMQALQKDSTGKGVVWFTVASNAKGKEGFVKAADAKGVRDEMGMANTAFLLDSGAAMAKAYSAKTTPHMFVIDKEGKLAYQGAIDNHPSANPETLKGAENYVTEAIESLEKGAPVQQASTTPYGCSVKY
jgi:peroxiredoxin